MCNFFQLIKTEENRNILYGFVGIIFFLFAQSLYASEPSQDFFEYLDEFSDNSGNLLDPLEYDQVLQANNDHKTHKNSLPSEKVDMKANQSSSRSSSSSSKTTMKNNGASL